MAIWFNKQNVAIGVATLWIGPADTPLVDNDVAYDADWSLTVPDWISTGATVEGVKFSIEPSTKDISIEESPTPALVVPDTIDIMIESALSEDTLESLLLAYGYGGSIDTHAASSGQIGYKQLHLSMDVGTLAAGLELKTRSGFWRRIHVPEMNSTGKTETSYRRSDSARTYPIELHAICDPDDVTIIEMTAVALP